MSFFYVENWPFSTNHLLPTSVGTIMKNNHIIVSLVGLVAPLGRQISLPFSVTRPKPPPRGPPLVDGVAGVGPGLVSARGGGARGGARVNFQMHRTRPPRHTGASFLG